MRLLVMLVGLLLGESVHALDVGQITVNGFIVAPTCSVTLGESANPVIQLPNVPASSLTSAGDGAGDTEFELVLSGCSFSTSVNVVPYFFVPALNLSPSGGRLKNVAASSPAANVELQLLWDRNPVNLAGTRGAQGAGNVYIPKTQTGGSLKYVIRYYAVGASTPGYVSSGMVWGVDYN